MPFASRCLALLFVTGLIGCGGVSDAPETVSITGAVSLDGETISKGEIIFRSADGGGGRADAGVIKDGTYTIDSTLGKKTVEIRSMRPVAGAVEQTLETGETGMDIEQYIPEQFNDKTALTADISSSGDTTFDFPMTTK